MDPVKILRRAWAILWSYQALWVFGLILALATAGAGNHGNNMQYRQDRQSPPPTSQNIQEAFRQAAQEIHRPFHPRIPGTLTTGQAFTTFLWVVGGFLVLMLRVGILVA